MFGRQLFWFLYSILLESCLFYRSNHLTSTLSTSTTSSIRLYDIPHLAALPPFGPHQPHQKKVWHLWKALGKDIFDVSNSQTCQDFLTQISILFSILFLGPKNLIACLLGQKRLTSWWAALWQDLAQYSQKIFDLSTFPWSNRYQRHTGYIYHIFVKKIP